MAFEAFSLADTYGRGVKDREDSEARAQDGEARKMRNEAMQMQRQSEDLFRSTAKLSVDPQSGEYDPVLHVKSLAAAGYPEAAMDLRNRSLAASTKGLDYFERVMPYMSAENYDGIRAQAEEGGLVSPGMLPEQYDEQVLGQLFARARGQQQQLESFGDFTQIAQTPDGTSVLAQREQRSGKYANVTTVRPRAERTENGAPSGYRYRGDGLEPIPGGPADKSQERSGIEAADANAIYRQSVGLFGGMFDPITGRIGGLNREQAEQVQGIAARASQIYQQNQGQMDHASAVEMALREVQGNSASGDAPQGQARGRIQRPGSDQPVQIRTPQEYAQLPSGATYIDPNGQERTKR